MTLSRSAAPQDSPATRQTLAPALTHGDPLTDIVVKGTKQTYAKCLGLVCASVDVYVFTYSWSIIGARRSHVSDIVPGHRPDFGERHFLATSPRVRSCMVANFLRVNILHYTAVFPTSPFIFFFLPFFPILILTDSLISSKSILAKYREKSSFVSRLLFNFQHYIKLCF